MCPTDREPSTVPEWKAAYFAVLDRCNKAETENQRLEAIVAQAQRVIQYPGEPCNELLFMNTAEAKKFHEMLEGFDKDEAQSRNALILLAEYLEKFVDEL